MDVLNEEQTLPANLGGVPELDLGHLETLLTLDNPTSTINFELFEDFLNGETTSGTNFLNDGPSLPELVYPASGGGVVGGEGAKLVEAAPPVGIGPADPHSHVHQMQALQRSCTDMNQAKLPVFCHALPDSPPDSGSEPYSPPDGGQSENRTHPTTYHVKAHAVSSMAALPSAPHAPPPVLPPPYVGGLTPGAPLLHAGPLHDYGPPVAGDSEPLKLNHLAAPPGGGVVGSTPLNAQLLMATAGGMNSAAHHQHKKRKYSDSPNNTLTPGALSGIGMNHMLNNIKQEPPGMLPDCGDTDDMYGSGYDMATADGGGGGDMFSDGVYQMIKWQTFMPTKWCTLVDEHYKDLPPLNYRVDADKGFNFSVSDDTFVCQKKNHFQVTVHVGLTGEPRFVKAADGTINAIDSFCLHFQGVKMESTSQSIKVEQSQSDRSKRPFYPVKMSCAPNVTSKVTVGRLHFSETTTNNMRKKGKPNPDQRYFLLVVALHAHCASSTTGSGHLVAAHASEKIIVRASNPGQFDSDVDVIWQKGHSPDSIFHAGRVGVNTDRPDEALAVHGNLKLTGHVIQPSDERVKTDIYELDTEDQLRNIAAVKVYKYQYTEKFAHLGGLRADQRGDTGVIAQQVRRVLPDAVTSAGDIVFPDGDRISDFQVVNKDRIYMENVGAVKELCKVTDKLENRINELETMNKKLSKASGSGGRTGRGGDGIKSSGSVRSKASSCKSSCSSVFVTSKSAATTNHHHHGDKRCHQGGAAVPTAETDVCSNRFIHVTIFVLVLVMSICLVLITVLYILEKNTTVVSHQHHYIWQNTAGGVNPADNISSTATTKTAMLPNTSLATLQRTLPSSTPQPTGSRDTPSTIPSRREEFVPESIPAAGPPAGGSGPLTPPNCLRMTCPVVCCGDTTPIDDRPQGTTKTSGKPRDGHHNEVDKTTTTAAMSRRRSEMMPPTRASPTSTRPPPAQPPAWGPTAAPGSPSDSGSHGHRGDAGHPGTRGEMGPAGSRGKAGPAGPRGETGPTAAPGSPSDRGSPRPRGDAGHPGTRGETGPAGSRGKAGPAGPRGETGRAGSRGEAGPAGPAGPAGAAEPEEQRTEMGEKDGGTMMLPDGDVTLASTTAAMETNSLRPLPRKDRGRDGQSGKTGGREEKKEEMEEMDNHVSYNIEPPPPDHPRVRIMTVGPIVQQISLLRDRRDVPALRSADVTVRLTQNHNSSLDQSYCSNDACRRGDGFNISYSVPFSSVFPRASLTVDFSMSRRLTLTLCQEREDDLCSMNREPSVEVSINATKLAEHMWDLPIGYFAETWFKFRVTSGSAAVTNVCENTKLGVDFIEYNLHFYRVCEKVL